METTETRQPLTPATRVTLEKRFAALLDSLGEADGQALDAAWDHTAISALQRAATPLGVISFEVTKADRRTLQEGYKATENWREGTPGRRSFTYASVHVDGEGDIDGFDFRDRGKAHGCGGTDMDAVACARHLNKNPEAAQEVKGLVLAFLDSEVEVTDGRRKVTVVFRGDGRWIVSRDCLVDDYWSWRFRPVRPRS